MAGPSRQRWTTILCFALLTAVTTVFFYRLVFHPGNTLTSFDIVAAQSEYKFVQWHSFSDWGRFPLWDPTVFCGKSIVGDSLPAVLNFPQWLFWITPTPALFGYILWFYATLGAWGMFLFAKRKGCDPQGAMLAAVVFVLGGKTAGHLYAGHVEVLITMLCLPWLMLAAEGVLEKPSFVRAGVFGGALALTSTCGSIQILYWHCLFLGAYALLWLLAGLSRRGWLATLRSAFAFAAGSLSFLVFAAPWWLPIISQTLLLSARARGTGYDFAAAYSPRYTDLLHLLWPLRGVPLLATEKILEETEYFWERTVYFGVIPLVLILPACLWPGKNRRSVVVLAFLAVITFLLSLGDHGPLLWLATRAIPGFVLFRCPGRMFFYTAFLVGLLVGLYVSGGGATTRKWPLLAISGALLTAAMGAVLLFWWKGDAPIRFVWLPIALLVLFVPVILLWMRGSLSEDLWKAAILLLVSADLFIVWQDHIVVAKTKDLLPKTPAMAYLVEQERKEEFRVLGTERGLNQTSAAKYGIEIVAGYHPGISGRYFDLYRKIWTSDESTSAALRLHSSDQIGCPAILDLMNVEYIAAGPKDGGLPGEKALVFPDVQGGPEIKVYRRDSALPRVCIVPGADVPAQGVPFLDALCSHDPRTGCLVEDRPYQGGEPFRPLPFERQSPSDLTTRFTSDKGGVVVISQAWHPDWRATDHGQLVEVRRVNYDFVGVCVGPGDHEIRVWYWPWDFYLGCYVAALGWATLAAAGAWTIRKRRRLAKAA